MLPPFQIRNLRSPIQPNTSATQDNLVRVSAPGYDQTISNHPSATLKYQDEERDTITIGSSSELIQKLGEPVTQHLGKVSRASRNPMAIATMLGDERKPTKAEHHVFDIDDTGDVRGVWQGIQAENEPKLTVPAAKMAKESTPVESSASKSSIPPANESSKWTDDGDTLLLKLRESDWEEIKGKRLRYENRLWTESMWTEEKKNKLAEIYERWVLTP